MKRWQLILREKNGSQATYSIYFDAETEQEAIDYFNKNFNRFNELVGVKKCRTNG